MKWYVLHVLTGAELEAQRQLREKGVDAVVLQETSLIRRGGTWREEVRTWFPGYVFVLMNYTPGAYYAIKSVDGFIGLLPKGGRPMPLPKEEVLWLLDLCGEVLTPSKVDFSGDRPVVVDGPLKELENYVVKYHPRQRRVYLSIPVLGKAKELTLSVLPV